MRHEKSNARLSADACPSAGRRSLRGLAALAAALAGLLVGAGSAAAALPGWPPVEFPLTAPAGTACKEPHETPEEGCPNTLVTGPDGAIWFLEFWGSRVSRMTTDGVVTHSEPTPTPNAQPEKIIAGPEGDLWFSEYAGDRIGRVVFEGGAFTGKIVEYPVGEAGSGPVGVAAGPDGRIWFVLREEGVVGHIDPVTAEIEEFTIPGLAPAPFGIAAGPDGAMWFTQQLENQIGRIPVDAVSAGEIDEFEIPGPFVGDLHAADIVQGPEGNLWFVEAVGNQVGRVDYSTGQVTEYPMPACLSTACGSFWITAGPDGNLWFTAWGNGPTEHWVGRATPQGVVEMEAVPTPDSQPYGIAMGPACDIWFAEFQVNRLARLPVGCPVNPSSTDFGAREVGAGPGSPQLFTLTNTGAAPATVSATEIVGPAAADFAIVPGGSCAGSIVAVGASCSVAVSFAPTAAGPRSAQLSPPPTPPLTPPPPPPPTPHPPPHTPPSPPKATRT